MSGRDLASYTFKSITPTRDRKRYRGYVLTKVTRNFTPKKRKKDKLIIKAPIQVFQSSTIPDGFYHPKGVGAYGIGLFIAELQAIGCSR